MATKDLGIVTAYGYAVAGGYTGTEQEFTALLGNLALTVEDLENMTVSVTTLEPTEQATASYSDGVLSLGIPKGRNGEVTQDDLDAQLENYATNEDLYYAFPNGTATGSIASFSDGADNLPMKSLKVTIAPKQAGSGDPSPSNVRPITGTSTANVTVTGKNMFDSARFLDATNWTESGGVYTGDSDRIASNKGSGLPYLFKFDNPTAGQYSISLDAMSDKTNRTGYVLFKYSDGTQSAAVEIVGNTWTHYSGTSTAGKTVTEVVFLGSNSTMLSIKNFQLETGNTATAYEPYTGTTTPVPLGQTVYGGEVDVVTGVMTITHRIIDLGTLNWGQYNATPSGGNHNIFAAILSGADEPDTSFVPVCSQYKGMAAVRSNTVGWQSGNNTCCFLESGDKRLYVRDDEHESDTRPDFKAYLSSVYLVYKLVTPLATVQLTPAEVRTLLETNNVWSNAGDVAVEYRADPTLAYNELANVIVSLGGNI